jgi:hypothetical protein
VEISPLFPAADERFQFLMNCRDDPDGLHKLCYDQPTFPIKLARAGNTHEHPRIRDQVFESCRERYNPGCYALQAEAVEAKRCCVVVPGRRCLPHSVDY